MTSDPKRLTIVGATDLERRLLRAARHERPSPELSARMAAGLGISAAAAVTAAAPAVAAKTTLATSGWISMGVVAVAVTAGVVGVAATRDHAGQMRKPAEAVAPAHLEPPAAAPIAAPTTAVPTAKRIDKVHRRPAAHPPAADIRDQIALMDAARTAVKAGSTERALLLLRRYDATFPAGAFRPEALALRIEALDEGGRSAEARALAREFLARYPQSPVAERVARVADRDPR
jgi:hypothetical protein